jgi:predicted transcriptional regulator
MQGQRIEEEQVEDCVSDQHRDQAVLHLLLDYSPWTVDELVRELDNHRTGVRDSLGRLAGAGLIHRLGEFVFVSRAGRLADEALG